MQALNSQRVSKYNYFEANIKEVLGLIYIVGIFEVLVILVCKFLLWQDR